MNTLINPFSSFRMSQGWTEGSHARNPAMDYATPVGHEYESPATGVYRRLGSNLSRTDASAAGHLGELLIVGGEWDAYRIRFAHNDHHIAPHGARVEAGKTILAATGNSGYVKPRPSAAEPHAGAHVHTYGLTPDGDRWNWTLHAVSPDTSGKQFQPFDPQEDDMFDTTDRDKLDKILAAVSAPAPSADYSLVRLADRPEVFLSVNRETVRWIKNERELELIRYTLRGVGAPAADRPVEVVGDLPPYGVIIGDRPDGYQ